MAGMLDSAFGEDPGKFVQVADMLCARSGYMKVVMRSKMHHQGGMPVEDHLRATDTSLRCEEQIADIKLTLSGA